MDDPASPNKTNSLTPHADTGAAPANLWALLVGVTEYKAFPAVAPLRGCKNDVDAVKAFLTSQMGVPKSHVKVLKNEQATRSAVLKAFKQFLIDNDDIPRDSQILFHFSGHGSQMPNTDGSEPDGRDETILPYDARVGDVFDIPDKTLAALLNKLAARKGDHITVILDCCHSGSGTRDITEASVRRAPPDTRIPPAGLDAEYLDGAASPGASTRSASQSGWAAADPQHVLLAGCLDVEEANEHHTPEGLWHGALTYFTLQYLRNPPTNATYADMHAWVRAQVSSRYPRQTPVCEGQRSRTLFGGAEIRRAPFIGIKHIQGNAVTLDAGLLHGLSAGSQVALYRSEAAIDGRLDQPVATLEVASVTATSAQAAPAAGSGVSAADIPLDALGVVTARAYAGARQTVRLAPAEGDRNQRIMAHLCQAILDAGGAGTPSPYLELLNDGDAERVPNLRVTAADGQLSIRDDQGKLLVLPEDVTGTGDQAVQATRRALESVARYRGILDLTNQDPSKLTGRIKLQLGHCADGDCDTIEPLGADPDAPLQVSYDPRYDSVNTYAIDVINASDLDVYPHVFVFNPDFSIVRLYPAQGEQDVLRRAQDGKPSVLVCKPPRSGLAVSLPGDQPGETHWDASDDCLKVILTTQPCDLGLLEQDALNVPAPRSGSRGVETAFEQLLAAVTQGAGTRSGGRPSKLKPGEDWNAATLPYTTVRRSARQKLAPSRAVVDLGNGIRLEKPDGFAGTITVSSSEPGRRGLDDLPVFRFPPGLAALPGAFQPVGPAGTRGLNDPAIVITLEADDELARCSITPQNPLRLRLPDRLLDGAADILPVFYDGQDFLPAGYPSSDLTTVNIVSLPPGNVAAPGTRGLGHAIQLFLIKKTGRYSDALGLRRATVENGRVIYEPLKREMFKPGDAIAVVVHGFTSDTKWMARDIPSIAGDGQRYAHCLAFDYESFATGVERNGADLADALRQVCGFGAHDGVGVHVYAHSMGCLVSRCLVELAGGSEFVDRVVLAGPPNNGTTLASLSRGFVYLLTALLNNVSQLPVLSTANWLVKEVYEQGSGWADIKVDSDVTRRLNSLTEPVNVPYLLLAGDNSSNQARGSRLARYAAKMLDKTLDAVFGEQNDGVIGVASLSRVRRGTGGTYPAKVVALGCDHFGYYADPQGREAIREWMTA